MAQHWQSTEVWFEVKLARAQAHYWVLILMTDDVLKKYLLLQLHETEPLMGVASHLHVVASLFDEQTGLTWRN